MLNETNKVASQVLATIKRADDVLVKLATEAYENAARKVEECAKRVRSHGNGPLADLYSDQLDDAMALFNGAMDDLRDTRESYPVR